MLMKIVRLFKDNKSFELSPTSSAQFNWNVTPSANFSMKKEISQLLPHLFIGCQNVSRDSKMLKKYGITHVLTVSDSIRFKENEEFQRCHVPVSDFGDSSLTDAIDNCSEFIESAMKAGGKVLLHCHKGQNRSPSIATGYLMKSYQLTLEQAFQKVREVRSQFAPHQEYLKQLQNFDLKLFGNVSLTEENEPLSVQSITKSILSAKPQE